MSEKSKGITFILGVIAGSVVGSVTALLFAPKSGKELRGDIKAGAEKTIEKGSEAIDQVSETVFEVSQKLEDGAVKAFNGVKQSVQQAVDQVKQFGKSEDHSATEEKAEVSGVVALLEQAEEELVIIDETCAEQEEQQSDTVEAASVQIEELSVAQEEATAAQAEVAAGQFDPSTK